MEALSNHQRNDCRSSFPLDSLLEKPIGLKETFDLNQTL